MKRYIFILVLMIFAGLTACYDSHNEKCIDPDPGAVIKDGEVELTFVLRLPSQVNYPSTYSMSEDDENEIEDLCILAFQVGNDNKERFAYKISAESIETDVHDSHLKRVKATVKVSDDYYRFVFLANVNDEVDDLDQLGGIAKTGVKEDVLKRLLHEKGYPADTNKAFPMWGESNKVIINSDDSTMDKIYMLRNVAKIDVIIDEDKVDNFVLTKAFLYNYNQIGHIVPDLTNLTALKPHTPTLPDDTKRIEQDHFKFETLTGGFVREIYTYETDVKEKHLEKTCIVVGGRYDGGEETFYRIDLVNGDENKGIPLLRNYWYLLKIVSVKGDGYPDEKEAFEALPMNIEVEVLEWNEGDLNDVVFDGQYFLGVSESTIYMPKPAADKTVTIKTDYPGGFTYEFGQESLSWLTYVSGGYDANAETSELTFHVSYNSDNVERIGYIYLTAGRLTHKITVIQGIKDEISLEIVDNQSEPVTQLVFNTYIGKPASEMVSQDYRVNWIPSGIDCMVSHIQLGDNSFNPGSQGQPVSPTTLNGGTHTYTIKPDPIDPDLLDEEQGGNPFREERSLYYYTIDNGEESISKSIELKLINYALIVEPDDTYPLDGSNQSFKIRTNGNWIASLVDDGIVAEIITDEGIANKTGYTFEFRMKTKDATNGATTQEIIFKNKDGLHPDVSVVIKAGGDFSDVNWRDGGQANCYILSPTEDGINIPVSQANADGVKRILDGDELEVELLWTDRPFALGDPNGVLRAVFVEGSGPDGILKVAANGKNGNALVAVKVDGVIRWSWHIWVLELTPDKTAKTYKSWTWMDRNLGAITTDGNDPLVMGLTYQAGRKDPFPGLASFTKTDEFPIYDVNGDRTYIDYKTTPSVIGSATNMLELSIQNPMTYYYGGYGYDWFCNSYGGRDATLWNKVTGKPTTYDPCPDGWTINLDRNIWYNANDIGFSYSSSLKGLQSDKVGFWPMAGYRNNSGSFVIDNIGTVGNYWMGVMDTYSSDGYALKLKTSGAPPFEHGISTNKSMGLSVRCVKSN